MKLQRDPTAAPCLVPDLGRGDPANPILPGEVLEVPESLAWCFGADVAGSGWRTPAAGAVKVTFQTPLPDKAIAASPATTPEEG